MAEQTQKRTYKKTLNLPRTSFSMKANLVQNEPGSIKAWEKMGLYQRIRQARAGSRPYVFHDGPPYANGSIHLGHLLNKVLKDLVTRSKTMAGYDCPFVPGWDCHGLPIEHKVLKEEGAKAAQAENGSPAVGAQVEIRRSCRKYAQKYVKLQTRQMQRLLTLADYDDPYITMDRAYESAVLEVFARMVDQSVVYRGLKPVHWSIENHTALADAELEYHQKQDTSVYVHFDLTEPSAKTLCEAAQSAGADTPGPGDCLGLMIWTTTPWTLPANLAVAVAPEAEYGLYAVDGRWTVIGRDLAWQVFAAADKPTPEPITIVKGSDLIGLTYQHPFIDDGAADADPSSRQTPPGARPAKAAHGPRRVVGADYVTVEPSAESSGQGAAGTGLVHTAPGHGVEDYQTGLREGLDIYCPVRGDGTFDQTAPSWLTNLSVWKANEVIAEALATSGHLFHRREFTHSYPHDWRGKTPVIFRATEQWFVDVNRPLAKTGKSIRQTALDVTAEDVSFHPAWGGNRMRSMLDSRPDWCLSRQRAWGLPIPAFYRPSVEGEAGEEGKTGEGASSESHEPLLSPASIRAVSQVIADKGSDLWFAADPEVLLEHYDPLSDPDAPAWVKSQVSGPNFQVSDFKSQLTKGADIFDVWFESGSSWHAAMQRRGLARHELDEPTSEPPRGQGSSKPTADAGSTTSTSTTNPEAEPHGPITDLYLEGSDQHRGWFQLSLLTAAAVADDSPFANLLTHGFMVDKQGRKMSKSIGNTLEVEDLMKDYGADVCRWWVCSLNTDGDMKVDEQFFKEAADEYRKVRNTLRFVLGNLGDFDPTTMAVDLTDADAKSIDAWAISELGRLIHEVRSAYETFRFRNAHAALFNFCNHTLSAVYLTAVKDRLYCDDASSPRRRRTQQTLWHIGSALIRLLAPVLPHSAEEAWSALHGNQGVPRNPDDSVHLQPLPEVCDFDAVPVDSQWPRLMAARERWLKAIERYRQANEIDNPLDLGLAIGGPYHGFAAEDLADLCAISRVDLSVGDDESLEVVDLRDQPRCERSWKRDGTVRTRADGGQLSNRDAAALGV